VKGTGVLTPEEAFDPPTVFAELQRRRIVVHEKVEPLAVAGS
jgi:hypothetical protein